MKTPEKIKLIRKQEKLSQKEFAKKLAVSIGTVSMAENGIREATTKLLDKISNVFGVDYDWLISKDSTSGNKVVLASPKDEFQKIISFLSNPKNKVDVSIYSYLLVLRAKVAMKSNLLEPTVYAIDIDTKRFYISEIRPMVSKVIKEYNLGYDTILGFRDFLNKLKEKEINTILLSNNKDFIDYIFSEEISEFKELRKEINNLLKEAIEKDENISLLLKHKIINPLDISYVF